MIAKLNDRNIQLISYDANDEVRLLMGFKPRKNYLQDTYVNRLVLFQDTYHPARKVAADWPEYLREYQRLDMNKLVRIHNVLNANRMGYGKTLETILMLKLHAETDEKFSFLIIVPKTIVYQWRKEFLKWWPESEPYIHCNPKRIPLDRPVIVIINYEKLLVNRYCEQLYNFQWSAHVCDEAHRIKNDSAQRTQKVKSIPSAQRIALTGTPILNRPDDLWSLLQWLDPKYVGNNYWDFVNVFCSIDKSPFGMKPAGLTRNPKAVTLLHKLLDEVAVINKDQFLTEGKVIIPVDLPMYANVEKEYAAIKDLVFESITIDASIVNALSQMMRLQQLTSSPEIFNEKFRNIKFDWIIELLRDNPDIKIVVFSRFKLAISALYARLTALKFESRVITGDISERARIASMRDFIEEKPVRVLAGTIGAMGQGLDGMQKVSSTVVFIDRDWSPAMNEQAEDRVNRFGQEGVTNVYVLNCMNSIDQYVGERLIRKMADIWEVLKGG